MTTTLLSLSSPSLVAEYVRQSDLQAFFEKRLAAPPDHAALLIRNGQLVDAYKGAHFSIGGIWQGFKTLLAGSSHIRILLADLKPFSVQTPIRGITKDAVEVAGVVTLELQLNPDRPQNILGLVQPTGTLTRDEILERFRPHLTDRVFEALIRRVDAAELRGNDGVQDKLQGDVMQEVERVAGDLGLIVRATSIEWATSKVERDAMRQADLDRAQDQLDHQLTLLKRNLGRSRDATEIELRTNVDLAKMSIDGDDEIARLTLSREVAFLDAREEAQRRQELQALSHEIETLSTERAARFENELAEAGQQIDVTRYRRALTRVELEIDALKQTHLAEMKKLGAFTDLEIEERTRNLELDVRARAERQSREQIAGLQAIERTANEHETLLREKSKDGQSRREIDAIRADAEARVAQLQAGANLTPEQILAINAGLSKDVAAVLVERARAEGSGRDETMNVMRELVQQATDSRVASEEQARAMFRMGIDGAVGVAHGAGNKSGEAPTIADRETPSTVECGTCGREAPPKAKFCVGCGHKLRN